MSFVEQLRRRPRWLLLPAAMAVLFVAQQFAYIPPGTRFADELQDAFHVPWYGLISLLLMVWSRFWPLPLWWRWGLIAGVLVTVAIGSEWLQQFTGRDSSWGDVSRDLLGAAAAAGVYATYRLRSLRGALLGVLGIALGLYGVRDFTYVAAAYAQREWSAGELLDASSHLSRMFFVPYLSTATADGAGGEGPLRIALSEQTWSGWRLTEPYANWQGYDCLLVDMDVSDGAPLLGSVRISYRGADPAVTEHFTYSFPVRPQLRRNVVPLAAMMHRPGQHPPALSAVAELGYYVQHGSGRELRLFGVRLLQGGACRARHQPEIDQ